MQSEQLYKRLAQKLVDAELNREEVVKLTAEYPELTVEDGYCIQNELVSLKLEQGHRIFAAKMGLTSQAKMKQMNVHEPIRGYILDYMNIEDGILPINELIHPKVEAEIAFVLSEDLEGPGITEAHVLVSTDYVVPALEIIDSRYAQFQFTLPDVIADNASSSRVFIGSTWRKPDELELDLVGVTLSINGELKDLGAGAAVLGHPARSVAMLANMLAREGRKLHKGDLILSGGITGSHQLQEGDVVSAKWGGLGSIEFVVKTR
ncbi:2-keto-4-pentenoate hydratase [Brevibacillus porteri]|uniref:2-keto-4-pentenoate hydratase n=1 Tax=Brevibacillus porteri TaxID=2126350 RepID=UPI00370B5C66